MASDGSARDAPSVAESWARIVAWLERNAPVTAALIAPPAAPPERARAAAAFGAPWPADLHGWYALHDGAPMTELWRCVLPMYEVLSLARMAETARVYAELAVLPLDRHPAPHANDTAFAFVPQFVPIGTDGCGDTLYVDLRPGELHGCVGEYGDGDADTGDPTWPSVAAMLSDVADSIEQGHASAGWLPSVEDGELSWDIDEQ